MATIPRTTTTSQQSFPLDSLLAFTGESLSYPLDTLPNLLEFVSTRCSKLAARRKIICGEYFNDPKPMQAVLNSMGYLGQAPLLRILLLHFLCKSRATGGTSAAVADVLLLLDTLRRDVRKLYISLESSLRQTIICGNKTRQQELMVNHCEKIACFTLSLRHINAARVTYLRSHGPRPALLVLPSQIAVASYGLYLRGSVQAGSPVAGYCGEEEECDSDASGYRMQIGKIVVDAKTERCLCSMMNDPRHSIFKPNVAFRQTARGSRIAAKALRACRDEELFVSYGGGFSLDFEATAASFCRSLAPDFTDVVRTAHLPTL